MPAHNVIKSVANQINEHVEETENISAEPIFFIFEI